MHRIALFAGLMMVILGTPLFAQVDGCTDPAANNFNPLATQNNGSCMYNAASRTPSLKSNLSSTLRENSGLIYWNDHIWTHNDGGNTTALFEMDTTGALIRNVNVSNATNVDWEDITQDDQYLYVGDFGNNASGNRQDLRIYRIAKSALLAGNTVTAEAINFAYADQTNFAPVASNTTNFDCEAMVAYNGSLYLFTKQWTSLGTSVYMLPATPGTWTAQKITTSTAPAGLVTGADLMPAQRSIAICGYTSGGARFLYLLYDFNGNDFFSGNKRYVGLNNFGQTEGIAFKNREYVFISRESLTVNVGGFPITFTQALEAVNLTTLLLPYYQLLPIENIDLKVEQRSSGREIKWRILPPDEFTTGWLQRRSATTLYQNIFLLTSAKGSYADEDPLWNSQQVFYRIMAIDKDKRASYSKEVKVMVPQGTTSAQISREQVSVSSSVRTPGLIQIFDMKGSKWMHQVYQSEKKVDMSYLPRGQYLLVVSGKDGSLRLQKTFIR